MDAMTRRAAVWTIVGAIATVITTVLAVHAFFFDRVKDGEKSSDYSEYLGPQVWPAGSVEETVARAIQDAAEAAGCRADAARLIEAEIENSPASAQTADMPIARARALIQVHSGKPNVAVSENGQGASAKAATSQAISRLLNKVTERVTSALDC